MTQAEASARLGPIGPGIWAIEGDVVPFMGLRLPTRAIVVRLGSGRLWIHSPVAMHDGLAAALARLGEVGDIVAPNRFHHLFLSTWAERYPDARLHAAPGLRAKRPDIAFARDLGATPDPAWAGDIDQVVCSGSTSFEEVVFFHRRSSVAIMTDLIINLRLEGQSPVGRWIARLDGIAFPGGGVSNLHKLGIRDRRRAGLAVEHMLAWAPRRVVIAHGEGFEEDATEALRQRFDWLRR